MRLTCLKSHTRIDVSHGKCYAQYRAAAIFQFISFLQVCNLWEKLRSGRLSTQHYGAGSNRSLLGGVEQEAAAALMETVVVAEAILAQLLHPRR